MPKKSDLIAGAVSGFLSALLAIAVLTNLAVHLGALRWALLVIVPVLIILGLYIAAYLSRRWPIFWPLAKYAVSGVLNTLIDFGILNFLIYLTGISAGIGFTLFKAAGFLVAVVNSFFWNKFWTFSQKKTEDTGTQFVKFAVVSTVVFFLNVGTATLIVNVVGPRWGLSPKLWANVASAFAIIVSLVGNFAGYKFLVFKESPPPTVSA